MADAGKMHDEMELLRLRMNAATAQGGQAYARLLDLAETRDSGQVRRIARFIASTYNGQAFPFDSLRSARPGRGRRRRHALVPGRTALGSCRPAPAGAGRRQTGQGGHREVGSVVARGILMGAPCETGAVARVPVAGSE